MLLKELSAYEKQIEKNRDSLKSTKSEFLHFI